VPYSLPNTVTGKLNIITNTRFHFQAKQNPAEMSYSNFCQMQFSYIPWPTLKQPIISHHYFYLNKTKS